MMLVTIAASDLRRSWYDDLHLPGSGRASSENDGSGCCCDAVSATAILTCRNTRAARRACVQVSGKASNSSISVSTASVVEAGSTTPLMRQCTSARPTGRVRAKVTIFNGSCRC